METWKIVTIAALLLSLVGFGVYQQSGSGGPSLTSATNAASAGTSSPGEAPTPSPLVGKALPAWNLSQWSNTPKPVSLAALAGKTALVEVFRTGCSHCQEAAPFMAALDARYSPRGLKLLGIQSPGLYKDPLNPENNWKDVQNWVKERQLKYPVAFDAKSSYFQGTISKQLFEGDSSRLLYPMMFLLGPNGKISYSQSGHDTAKAIQLAVELEKRFPTSKNLQQNAKDLVKWLAAHLPELELDSNLSKAMVDDIAQRLKQ